MSDAEVAILVPMWGRTERIEQLLASIERNTRVAHTVWFIACSDDEEVLTYFSAPAFVAVELSVISDGFGITFAPDSGVRLVVTSEWPSGIPGDYARKINLGYRVTDEPFLFTGAIDLCFRQGWWEQAMRKMNYVYDPPIGVVGTNDLTNRRTMTGNHSTHSLVRRSYIDECGTIDEPGKVLHEGYWHEFVDDEFVRTAQYRRRYVHAVSSVVEHLHPMGNKCATDDIYDMHPTRMEQGRNLFMERQHLWEGTVR